MNVLVFTTLYPNEVQHRHGVFIENRVLELARRYKDVSLTVIAPVPYFPAWISSSKYSHLNDIPFEEIRHGISVFHPRYIVIPKIGMNITPWCLYLSALKKIKELIHLGDKFDVIDAHYFYPDGVVAQWLSNKVNIPVSITARGTDINVIPQNKIALKRIQHAIKRADINVAVSKDLANKIHQLVPQVDFPQVLRNGVDLDKFNPEAQEIDLPFKANKNEKIILSVGNLIELKGHHLVIKALKQIENTKLIIIGDGEERDNLGKLVRDNNLGNRVFFTGNITQKNLPSYYAKADLLVLASSREGMPNVLLESIACGTPVVATDVGGSREIIQNENAGVLLASRQVDDIAKGILRVLKLKLSTNVVRSYAEQFSWDATSSKQYQLLVQLLDKP